MSKTLFPRRQVDRWNHSAQCLRLSWLMLGAVLFVMNGMAAPTMVTNTLVPDGRFATEVYVHDSGVAGPTVMIVGGVHGNEPAGALAAEAIRHWPITRGILVVVPRANVPALAANKRLIPDLDTNLSNLNRNYPRVGKDEPPRGELADAIWNLALKYKPEWLLDLHEGFDFNQINDKSVGSSVIASTDEKARAAADLMLAAVNNTITDDKLKFSRRGPPVDGSLARGSAEHLHLPSLILETTSKQPMEKRVSQHELMVRVLFAHLGLMPPVQPKETAVSATDAPATATPIRIALYKGPGTGGAGPTNLLARLNHGSETSITEVTPEQIRDGVLTHFDVAIFAGGSGSKQAEALGEPGRAAVKQFVGNGGGYVGICAGAYLATSGYPWSLGLVNARTVSPKWQRGKGPVKLELTDHGRKILGSHTGQFDCVYHNGPIVKPDTKDDLPAMETLAHFRTEYAENGSPAGVMVDSPAIFSGTYKGGLVICVSPHPEQTPGLEEFIPHAVNWVAPGKKTETKLTTPEAQ